MGKAFLSVPECPDPSSYLMGTEDTLGRAGADCSPPSAEFKNEWAYTSTPHIYLNGKYRDSFTFTLTRNYVLKYILNVVYR
jgi:hypothetical protein